MNYEQFASTVTKFKDAYLKNIDRYKTLSEKTGIPPELIAVIHHRENTKDYLAGTFNCYLHNGQTLGSITTMEPKGNFFTDFDEAAVDAVTTKLSSVPLPFGENTDIATMLTFAESYNGFGYANNEYVNPYLYSGTNIYVSGKYTADHIYDPSVVDNQVGTYILLYSIINE